MAQIDRSLLRPFGLFVALCLAAHCLGAASARAESVSRLLLEAQDALTSADFEPDPLAKLTLLRRALARLDRIVAEHRDNPLANQIIDGGRVAGTSRPEVAARIARLRAQPDICFSAPDADCLTSVAIALASKLAFLRDRVTADTEIALALADRSEGEAAKLRTEEAMKSAVRIKAGPSRARALIKVAGTQARIGDTAGARRSLDHAFKAAQSLAADGERSRIMSQIASGLIDLEDHRKALEILRTAMHDATEVRSANTKVELLTRLARLFQAVGDRANAERLVDSARLTLDRMGDAYDRAWGRQLTARALMALGQTSAARRLLDRSIAAAKSLDEPRIRASLVTQAARLLSDWGDEDAAGDLLGLLLSEGLELDRDVDRREILWWIARARIAAGHTPGARLALEFALEDAARSPGSRSAANLSRLAVALAEIGDAKAADTAVMAALEAARAHAGSDREAADLLVVAVAFAKIGRGAAAADLLADVRRAGGYRTQAFTRRAGLEPLLSIATALSGDTTPERPVTPHN